MHRISGLARRHPVSAFFVLAYAVNVIACGLGWLGHAVAGFSAVPPWVVGIFSPTIAGVTMAAFLGDRAEVGRILSAMARWRIGARWFLVGMAFTLLPLGLALPWPSLDIRSMVRRPGSRCRSWSGRSPTP
jgi:hypothetical protein